MFTNVFNRLLCFLFKPFFKTLSVFNLGFEMKHWMDLDLHTSLDYEFTCLRILVFTLLSNLKSKASVLLHLSVFSFDSKNPQHGKKHQLEQSDEQFKYRGLAWLLNLFKVDLCFSVMMYVQIKTWTPNCWNTPAILLLPVIHLLKLKLLK